MQSNVMQDESNEFMRDSQLTWSATTPPVESGGPAAGERLQLAERRKRYCNWPGLLLSHNLTGRSTRRLILTDKKKENDDLAMILS